MSGTGSSDDFFTNFKKRVAEEAAKEDVINRYILNIKYIRKQFQI